MSFDGPPRPVPLLDYHPESLSGQRTLDGFTQKLQEGGEETQEAGYDSIEEEEDLNHVFLNCQNCL